MAFGGGYQQPDLDTFFKTFAPAQPTVVSVSVDGATNNFNPNDNLQSSEVTGDIEIAGMVATGATIAVYFAPNTEQGAIDAYRTALFDATNNPSVISHSFGRVEPKRGGWGPQSVWHEATVKTLDGYFQNAADLGIAILVASGDSGSSGEQGLPGENVLFPASSPNVTACGGTLLTISGQSAITSETVWNNPPWQRVVA
jgi:kumamolisin